MTYLYIVTACDFPLVRLGCNNLSYTWFDHKKMIMLEALCQIAYQVPMLFTFTMSSP